MSARRLKLYFSKLLTVNYIAIAILLAGCGGNETSTTETSTNNSGIELNSAQLSDANLETTATNSYLNDLATLPVQTAQPEDYETPL